MGKFVVKEAKGGLRFNLKAANGEVVGVSEVYTAEDSCMNGIASVRKNMANRGALTHAGETCNQSMSGQIFQAVGTGTFS